MLLLFTNQMAMSNPPKAVSSVRRKSDLLASYGAQAEIQGCCEVPLPLGRMIWERTHCPPPPGKEEQRDDVKKTAGEPRQRLEAAGAVDTVQRDLTQQLPVKLRVQPA